MKRQRLLIVAAVVSLAAFTVTACGDDDDSDSSSDSSASAPTSVPTSTPTSSSGGSATVGMEQNSSLGSILDDSQGRTVYLFEKDTGTTSECNGACASAWPPVVAKGKPVAGNGVDSAKIGTTTRSDGTKQVTYNGHPLYTYSGDSSPGDTNGQGVNAFGALWYVVSPAGSVIASSGGSSSSASSSTDSSSSGSSSNSGGGFGY